MRIRAHLAVTLDGYVSAPEGYPAVGMLTDFRPGESHGNAEFMAECDAVAMGRNTFQPAVDNAWWPWPDKTVHVVTSRPLPADTPDGVVACAGGPAGLVEQLRDADYARDVQVLAGPDLIIGLFELDALDRLELQVLPILGGGGRRLFDTDLSRRSLQLDRVQQFEDGTVGLEYALH